MKTKRTTKEQTDEPALSVRELKGLLRRGSVPPTPRMLHALLREILRIDIPARQVIRASAAPFDYIVHSFFEGVVSPRDPGLRTLSCPPGRGPADCVVWAARGAGKTFLGAVVTMLDLVFKPGIEVRILGGSLEQSQRMHEHLRKLFERPELATLLDGRVTARRTGLLNGSRARILAQSQTSVRGTRVQKVRCDEVELFDPEVWEAAQLATRSMPLPGPWGDSIRGSVEALSTLHRPYGIMWDLVSDAATRHAGKERRRVFRWGFLDVLARCTDEHECPRCVLEPECAGRAKRRDARATGSPGHVSVDDAVRMKTRVSLAVWESEMLCLRPRRSDCVLPEFDPALHVGDWTLANAGAPDDPSAALVAAFDHSPPHSPSRRWVAGMDFGLRAPTVVLLAWYRDDDPERVLHVEAEHVRAEWTLDRHLAVLLGDDASSEVQPDGWPAPRPAIDWVGVDPAGHQRSEQTGVSTIAVMRKAGLAVRARRLALQEGLEVLRARLRPAARTPGVGGSSPRLFIHRRCVQLIESLQRYHYPEDRPETIEPVKDGSDHAVDALRYLVLNLDRPHSTTHRSY